MSKTAIVTGASRGFGRGIAHVLATEGNFKVFATARNKSALDTLKDEVDSFKGDGELIPYVLDQNNDEDVKKFSEEIILKEEKIDLLVNSAYQGLVAMTPHFGKPFWERPISVYDGHMNVGVRSSYVMSKLIVPSMIKNNNGLILQISSYGGFFYLFDVGYGVAHAAMDRLSCDMAIELKEHNVKAITLHPGGGQTEITAFPDGESPKFVGRAVYALIEKADDAFLSKSNGKTLFTIDLAKKFDFREDYDHDGSINEARYENSKPIKEMMLKALPQYDSESPLPSFKETNNSGFANLFPGAKNKKL